LAGDPHKKSEKHLPKLSIMTTANTLHLPYIKFPLVLHTMLEDAKVKGFEHVVSWLPCSNMFKIHNPAKFTQDILKHYFPNQKFYKSFLRQLNIYGFDRINAGPFRGAYSHSSFVRGDREIPISLLQMERVRVKTRRQESFSNDSVGFSIAPSWIQGDDMTAPCTPASIDNTVCLLSPLMSPCEKQIAQLSPFGIAAPSTSSLRAYGGMNAAASSREEGIGMKYAPHIPDAFVGDIIYLFGSDDNEDDILMKATASDCWEDALSSLPSPYD
jgi:hypothetical protein